jgi:hypothetical protein
VVSVCYVYPNCLLKYARVRGTSTQICSSKTGKAKVEYLLVYMYCRNKSYKNGKGAVQFTINYGALGKHNSAADTSVIPIAAGRLCRVKFVEQINFKQCRQCSYNITLRRVRESLLPLRSNKYYLLVCVRVALLIHHATRTRHIVTSFVSPLSPPHFSKLSH